MASTFTGIPVKRDTRDEVRALKRGGEDWDTLLQKMAEQYDPEVTTDEG